MSAFSKVFLLFSFFILIFNGSSLGFIYFYERLGMLLGYGLFIFTSLTGLLFASLAEDHTEKNFYYRYCKYGNLLVAFLPLYLEFLARKIYPFILSF